MLSIFSSLGTKISLRQSLCMLSCRFLRLRTAFKFNSLVISLVLLTGPLDNVQCAY